MTNYISVEDLTEETLRKLGIKLPPTLREVGSNLLVLGKVFNALKGLEDAEAVQVLKQAQMYIISRMNAPEIDSVHIPGQDVAESYAPPIDWTLQVVAKIFKLKPADLKLRKRDADIVEARQVAMYVLCMTNKYSFTQVGQAIGGRSPATVSHAFGKIAYKVKEDQELWEKVEEIRKLIGG